MGGPDAPERSTAASEQLLVAPPQTAAGRKAEVRPAPIWLWINDNVLAVDLSPTHMLSLWPI